MAARQLIGIASLCFASVVGIVGCAADGVGEDAIGQSGADLVTFGPEQCRTPSVSTSPKLDAANNPIPGSARTTVNGCILAKSGETGAALAGRTATLISNAQNFASLADENGQLVFNSFRPQAASGSLATGLVQDVDVTLNVDFSPSTRLRVTRRQNADGSLNVGITNITPLKATIAFFPVTAANANDLTLSVKLSPEGNGMSVVGTSEVVLQQQQDRAAESAQMVHQLFDWLTLRLAQ
jgi:hypothetical protein